jgi:hypothetical protein
VIEVSASRLEVALCRGSRVAAARAIRHHTPQWEPDISAALAALAEPLRDLVDSLDARGMHATVLAATSTAAAAVHGCPARAGASAAVSASLLALGNLASYPVHEHPAAVIPLLRDRAASPGAPPFRRILAYSERDDTVESIAKWVESAGLRFAGLIPLDAVELAAAVGHATSSEYPDELRASLWVGEHKSVLAAGTRGTLRFVRSIAVGAEAFAEALSRPIIRRSGGDAITLSRNEARAMLAASGIPDPFTVVDEARSIDGAAVLPLLQPVLQRLTLDVKQSLRFGFSEAERAGASHEVIGAGRFVPHLDDALARQLSTPDSPEDSSTETTVASEKTEGEYSSALCGGIASFIASPLMLPTLQPRATADQAGVVRVRTALRVGLAACLTLVAAEGVLSWQELHLARDDAKLASGFNRAPLDALHHAQQAADAVQSSLDAAAPPRTGWAALFATVSQASIGRVALTAIEADTADSAPRATLRGKTLADPLALRDFIDALEQCPVVAAVDLKHTYRQQQDNRDEQQFELCVTMIQTSPRPASALTHAPSDPS